MVIFYGDFFTIAFYCKSGPFVIQNHYTSFALIHRKDRDVLGTLTVFQGHGVTLSNLGEKVGCFNMHHFNLSIHILHVFIQEFEIILNLYCGVGRLAKQGQALTLEQSWLISIRSINLLTDILRLKHFKCRVKLERRSSGAKFLA